MSRTVLVGLDGATFSILDPLMEEGVMPFLKEFIKRGVRSNLLSTAQPLTPPAWTSLTTGRSPGNHNIFDFVRVERGKEHPTYTLATSGDVQCETIWSIAGRQNRKVISLNFPISFPPEKINGSIVPGFVPWRHLSRAVHPPELYQKLKTLPGFDPQALAFEWEAETKAIQALPDQDYEEWIKFHIRREQQWFEIVRYLMTSEPSDLTAIIFDGVDKLQHVCWRFLDPNLQKSLTTEWERKIRALCHDYFRQLDGFIAEIARLAGPDARLFMASDHGFGPTDQIFYVNTWLGQHGYLAWQEGVEMAEEGRLTTEGHKSHVLLFDWSRTTACALTASSNGIYIHTTEDRTRPGVPLAEYEAFRQRLKESLLAFTDPSTHEPVVTRAMTREEAFPGEYMERAPDLTLVLRDHGFISVLNAEEPFKWRPWIIGTHMPLGIFIAGGEGIRRGLSLSDPLSILDVTPAMLYSLGLPIPEDLEGRFAFEIFEPSLMAHSPPLKGEPTLLPAPRRATESHQEEKPGEMEAEQEDRIFERLKALGYIE
ncbi:MAG TPA: alkaline phosphatase family protein [Pyrinomonadaceae bacterium]|jgi:predicted AlkP superfamily phosphohydrolase/phosphomutase|nr:alkaline phosphatase family protein [Pyrinomonadaceae bacterium]